jgi:RNA polymerase sigma factor (sigma-70 family)
MPELNEDDFRAIRGSLLAYARQLIRFDLQGLIDPSDLVHETICQVLQAPPRDRNPAQMMALLRIKARDRFFDRLRRYRLEERGRQGGKISPPTTGSTPSSGLRKIELKEIMEKLLGQLPEAQAEAVYMKHCEGMRVEEICRVMKMTPQAVGGLLKRGMEQLRELLPPEA